MTDEKTNRKSRRRPRPSRKPTGETESRDSGRAAASKATKAPPQRARARRLPSKPERAAPIIGIPCSYQPLPHRDQHTQAYFYLYSPYVTAISEAGGVPVVLPVGLEGRYPNRVLEILDGVMFVGCSRDIDPNRYKDVPHARLGPVDPRKDRMEIDLFNLAFNRNLPVLGLCRGAQLINVALDGTLYQDIESQVRMAMNHYPNYPHTEPCHRVEIDEGTKLHRVLGESTIWVNSTHHQAVKLHGKGLVVSARASDGVIEGLEHPTKKWVIGVQWHPELLWRREKIQAKLFLAFVEACKT
jgi:putative glutamine amidotransferase